MQSILGKYVTQTIGVEMRKQESILETVCEHSKCCGFIGYVLKKEWKASVEDTPEIGGKLLLHNNKDHLPA